MTVTTGIGMLPMDQQFLVLALVGVACLLIGLRIYGFSDDKSELTDDMKKVKEEIGR